MPELSSRILFAIFVGGGLGSVVRFSISYLFSRFKTGDLPFGTLTANIVSCIIMGLAWSVFSNRMESSDWLRMFVLVGFCGGLSTFSTFSYETFLLIKSNQHFLALLNVLISVALCLIVFFFFVRKV